MFDVHLLYAFKTYEGLEEKKNKTFVFLRTLRG